MQIPSYRFDISLAEDLIEEIARLHGYDKIPTHSLKGTLEAHHLEENAKDLQPIRQNLQDQGYQEIILATSSQYGTMDVVDYYRYYSGPSDMVGIIYSSVIADEIDPMTVVRESEILVNEHLKVEYQP